MNIEASKKLLNSLEKEWDRKKPLKNVLEEQYTIKLFGHGVVSRTSKEGRISQWLNTSGNKRQQTGKVRQIFAEALRTLQRDPQEIQALSLSFRMRLVHELQKELHTIPSIPVSEIREADDLKPLFENSEENLVHDKTEKIKNSLLRDRLPPVLPLAEYLQTMLSDNLADSLKQWNAVYRSQQTAPSHTLQTRSHLIAEAQEFNQLLDDAFLSDSGKLPAEVRAKTIQNYAEILSVYIHDLAPGKALLYAGSYGTKILSWDVIFKLLKLLPEDSKQSLPTPVRKIINKEQLPAPEEFSKTLIHEVLTEMRQYFPAIDPSLDLSPLHPLFYDSTRKIEGWFASILPQKVLDALNERLQKGLIGNTASLISLLPTGEWREWIPFLFQHHAMVQEWTGPLPFSNLIRTMSFLPGPMMADILDWIGRNGQMLEGGKQREEFIEQFEQKLNSFAAGYSDRILRTASSYALNLINQTQKMAPAGLLEMTGLDRFTSGEFWIEFEKQPDGTFHLAIYGTGQARRHHPVDDQGRIGWPLRIENVAPEKLTVDFFHRLLYHHIEPTQDPAAISRAEDIYDGLLAYLGGSRNPSYLSNVPDQDLTQHQLLGNFLFGSSEWLPQSQFTYHLNNFLAFCSPYCKGDNHILTVPSQEVADALTKGMAALQIHLEPVRKFLDSSYLNRLETTFLEVTNAIEEFRSVKETAQTPIGNNPLNLSPENIRSLRQAMYTMNIEPQDIQSLKPTLIWALGDEIEEWVDALVESLTSQPFKPAPRPALPANQKGWLRQFLASTYYRIAFEALKTALELAKLYQKGWGPFLVFSLVDRGSRYLLPEPIYLWYMQVLGALKRTVAEIGVQIVLRAFLNSENSMKLEQLAAQWKQSARHLIQNASGKRILDFEVTVPDSAMKQASPIGEMKIPESSPNFSCSFSRNDYDVPYITPKVTLTKDNALSVLNSWKSFKSGHRGSQHEFLHYLHVLWNLDISAQGEEAWWEAVPVEDIPVYLDTLGQISANFQVEIDDWSTILQRTNNYRAKLVCANYNLLCLMEKLARRSPDSHLEGFRINAYPLLYWFKDYVSTIDHPAIDQKIRELCHYFFPHIDLNSLPSNQELRKEEAKTLFYYPSKQDYNDTHPFNKFVHQSHVLELCLMERSLEEFRYFQNRLQDPAFRERCNQLKILDPAKITDYKKENIKPNILFTEIPETDQLRILFKESIGVGHSRNLFPPIYALLRRQALFCMKHIAEKHNIIFRILDLSNRNPVLYILEPSPKFYDKFQFDSDNNPEFTSTLTSGSCGGNIITSIDISKTAGERKKDHFTYPIWSQHHIVDSLTQSHIAAASTAEAPDLITHPHDRKLFAMIHSEKEDQLVRALAFFKTHLDKLSSQSPECLTFLEIALLKAGALPMQLKKSPLIAQSIGELMAEICQESFKKRDFATWLWAIHLGIKLKRLCVHFSPSTIQFFPNYYQFLENNPLPADCEEGLRNTAERLKILADEIPQQDKVPAAMRTAFRSELKWQSTKDSAFQYNLIRRICDDFECHYQEMLPSVSAFLENQTQAQAIAECILEDQKKTVKADPAGEWMHPKKETNPSSEWILEKGQTILNFVSGVIINGRPSRDLLLDTLKENIGCIHPRMDELLDKEDGRLATLEDALVITYTLSNGRIQFRCTLKENDKTYTLRSPKGFSALTDPYWLEESEHEEKELLIPGNSAKPFQRLQLRQEPKKQESYQILESRMLVIETKAIQSVLEPLATFCPLDKITCWKDTATHQLCKITLQPYQLDFMIERKNGKVRAVCQEKSLSGYSIAPQQKIAELKGFTNYLLLENTSGQRKVLIPEGKWIGALAERFIPLHDAFSFLTVPLLQSIQPLSNGKCFGYDLSSDGELTSRHPEALVYLVVLYLLQGQLENAKRACDRLEVICRNESIDRPFSLISLCCIPFDLKESSTIRQRIFAALEENRLMHPPAATPQESKESFEHSCVIMAVLLADLQMNQKETHPRKKISPSQEWFLYQALFSRIQKVSQDQLPSKLTNAIPRVGLEHLLELAGVTPGIIERYKALREKYGQPRSIVDHATEFASHVIQTEPMQLRATTLFETPQLDSSSNLQALGHIASSLAFASIENLNLPKLRKQMMFEVTENPPLTLAQLNATRFKRHFITYYAIAKCECGNQKKQQLASLLKLIKGGWDSQTQQLIEYLEAVMAAPWIFEASEKLSLAIAEPFGLKLELHEQLPKLYAFFSNLRKRSLAWKAGVNVASLSAKQGANLLLSSAVSKCSPGWRQIPNPYQTISTAKWIGRFAKALWEWKPTNSPVATAPSLAAPAADHFQGLEGDDQRVDQFLDKIFDTLFDDVSDLQPPDANSLEKFPIAEDEEEAVSHRLQEMNQSIAIPEEEAREKAIRLRFKGTENLWTAYQQLIPFRNAMKQQWEQEQQQLLKAVNATLPSSHAITLLQLKRALMEGNFESLGKEIRFKPDTLKHLERALLKHYLKEGRLGQLDRLIYHFKMLSESPPEQAAEKLQEKVESIARECKARRAYTLSEMPIRIIRRLITLEAGAPYLLWNKQIDRIKELLANGEENAVIELIMGYGKTDVVIPLEDTVLADGRRVVVNIIPKTVAKPAAQRISEINLRSFCQNASTFQYDRSIPLTQERLDAYQVVLERTQEDMEMLNSTKEDFQALELQFFDQLFGKAHPNLKEAPTLTDNLILQLKDILKKIRTTAKVVGDEVQELLFQRDELNFTLGCKSFINRSYYHVLEACMKHVMQDPRFAKLLENNDLEQLSVEEQKERLAPLIAAKMSRYAPFQLTTPEEREEFIHYVTGQMKVVTPNLKNHPKFKEINLVKGFIGVLLKVSSANPVHVKYGNTGKDHAKPFRGNMDPQPNSSIQDPYETLCKTFFMFYQNGLEEQQTWDLVDKLNKGALAAAKAESVSFRQTKAYKLFGQIFPKEDLEIVAKYTGEEKKRFCEKAKHNHQAIQYFVRYIASKKIEYWNRGLCSNSQNFFSMFQSGFFDTGTPYNYETYPSSLKMLWDKSTLRKALKIMTERCPKDGIHVLENSAPRQVLQECLDMYFSKEPRFSALIDGGALLKGLDNLTVAKAMRDYCSQQRPDIKAIVFYQNDHLVYMDVETQAINPFTQCPYPPTAYLSYFDEKHGFAANIPQKENGIGFKLVGSNTEFYKEEQEWFRMRGLRNDKWVEPVDGSDVAEKQNFQQIHLGMTREMRAKIAKHRNPVISVLKNIMKTHFVPGSPYTSLIDGGSFFKEVDNLAVAQAMLESIQERDEIKAIVFYQKDARGKYERVYLEKGITDVPPKPFEDCPYQADQCLTYFDERHGFAANTEQNEKNIGFKLVRAEKAETTPNADLSPVHIHKIQEADLKGSPSDIPTLTEILLYSIRQEVRKCAQNNYDSYRQKVLNVVRRAILDKMYQCTSISQMVKLFVEFEHIFVKIIEDDPEKLYGWTETTELTTKVLEKLREHTLQDVEKSQSISPEEKKAIRNTIETLATGVLPENVTVYLKGTQVEIGLLDNLEKEITQAVENENVKQHENEHQLDLELSQEINHAPSHQHKPFAEWDWKADLGAYSTDWQQPQNRMFSLPFRGWKTPLNVTPPIHRLCNIIQQESSKALSSVWQAFDKRIWLSNNFLPKQVRAFFDSPATIGSKGQCDLHDVLIDLEENVDGSYQITSIGCLSIHDAAFWTRKLYQNGPSQTKHKRVVYNMALRNITAGDPLNLEKLTNHPDLKQLEVQLKFLNADSHYEPSHTTILRKWLKAHHPGLMRDAFERIYGGKARGDYELSPLEVIFEEFTVSETKE